MPKFAIKPFAAKLIQVNKQLNDLAFKQASTWISGLKYLHTDFHGDRLWLEQNARFFDKMPHNDRLRVTFVGEMCHMRVTEHH